MYIVTINDYNCVVCVAFISCNDNSDIYKLKKKYLFDVITLYMSSRGLQRVRLVMVMMITLYSNPQD